MNLTIKARATNSRPVFDIFDDFGTLRATAATKPAAEDFIACENAKPAPFNVGDAVYFGDPVEDPEKLSDDQRGTVSLKAGSRFEITYRDGSQFHYPNTASHNFHVYTPAIVNGVADLGELFIADPYTQYNQFKRELVDTKGLRVWPSTPFTITLQIRAASKHRAYLSSIGLDAREARLLAGYLLRHADGLATDPGKQ